MDRRPNRYERILRRQAERERRRRLRLELFEHDESSESSHHAHEKEDLDLGESDVESDVNMNRQKQFEQEQMEDDSLTEGDISSNNNNVDWSSESTDSAEDITHNESDEFDEVVYLRVTLTEWASRGVSKRKVNSLLSFLRRVHPELPKTYLDFDAESENENKENDMLLKKKGLRKRKVRMLNESTTDDSDSTTLPQVNFDILNEVKNIHVSQVENKEREKASRKQPVENHVRFKVLQEFQNNCSQSCQQEQLKKVYNSQCENNVKKHEKQHKIDNIKQKNLVSNKTIQKKRNALITSSNSKTSFVPSSIKDKVISSTTSEVSNTSSCNLSISASDFSLSNVPETTEFSFPSSMYMNSLNEKSCSSQIASLVHSTFDKVGEEERKSQSEESSYSFQNEGNCGCKYCHNEIKLSSTILLEITKKLDSMLINQAIIVRSVNPDYSKSMIPSNIPSIPLKSKEDFKKMDMFVTANRVNYEAVRDLLYSKCISAPGTSVPSERSVTGYILSKLISNGLAKQISWSGSEGDKTRFSDTKLCEVVFNAVKLRFPDSFLLHSEAKIKRWFQTANGRKESNNSNS